MPAVSPVSRSKAIRLTESRTVASRVRRALLEGISGAPGGYEGKHLCRISRVSDFRPPRQLRASGSRDDVAAHVNRCGAPDIFVPHVNGIIGILVYYI